MYCRFASSPIFVLHIIPDSWQALCADLTKSCRSPVRADADRDRRGAKRLHVYFNVSIGPMYGRGTSNRLHFRAAKLRGAKGRGHGKGGEKAMEEVGGRSFLRGTSKFVALWRFSISLVLQNIPPPGLEPGSLG